MTRFMFTLLVCIGAWAGSTVLDVDLANASALASLDAAGSDPICMLGDRKALVVFVRFKQDTAATAWDSSACYQWRETPNTVLMPWMSTFLADECSDPGSCPDTTSDCVAATAATSAVEPSLTDFYDAMSNGKYWFWGNVHPTVEVTDYVRSAYASSVAGVGQANCEILTRLDASIDFSEYDRNPKDGYVDQLVMVYRTFKHAAGDYTGFAWLAGSDTSTVDSTFVTNDIVDGDTIKIDLNWGATCPGGITLEGQNIQVALQQAAHESGHLFFSRGSDTWRFTHIPFISTFGVMDADSGEAGLAYSAFERERLGWITPANTTTSQTGLSLAPAFRGGTAVKVVAASNDTTEFFLLENRARTTWYEQEHPEFPCRFAAAPQGVAAYHVELSGSSELALTDGRYHKLVDVETPEGLFEASGATIDRTKPRPFRGLDTLDLSLTTRPTALATYGMPNGANTFAAYTTPNTNAYYRCDECQNWEQKTYTGLNVHNITFGADSTVTLDVVFGDSSKANHVFRPSSGAYTAAWKGTLYLAGDVTIDSLATVSMTEGTSAKAREGYDRSCLFKKGGVDTSRVELVIAGGGTLDVNGTSGSWVTFTSTDATPDTADWYGIRLAPNGAVDLNYADVGYGVLGVSAAATPLSVNVANSRIHHHSIIGIYEEAVADTVEIHNSVIDSSGYAGIYLVQKKSLTATPYFRTKIHNNRIFGNSYLGGLEVGLDNLGGTGVQRDSLWQNTIGHSPTPGQYGVWSYRDGGMSGSHITSAHSDTITTFLYDGVTLDGISGATLKRMTFSNIAELGSGTGRALVLHGASSASVDESKFAGTNYTHVWNDSGCTVALTDTNAFYNVAGPDTMVWNWDPSVTMTAQRNWWNQASCNVGPEAKKFYGLWDKASWLCSAPSLALPDPWSNQETAGATFELRLSLTPNPSASVGVIRYEVEGRGDDTHEVAITIFNVAGRRMRSLLHERLGAGAYEIVWDPTAGPGEPLTPGVYFVRYTVDDRFRTAKLVISR